MTVQVVGMMLLRLAILLVTVSLAPVARVAFAQTPTAGSGEYTVKAAWIYNFAKFVDWPTDAAAGDLIIGVVGQDPCGPALEALPRKTVKDRPIQVKRFATLDALERGHIRFVSSSEQDSLVEILAAILGDSVLTVGETASFADAGGISRLVTRPTNVRFQINVAVGESSRLQISSQLLRLAEIVDGDCVGGN